jgi:hypothetical protein
MEYWENYSVVYLTPDSDRWDPNTSAYSEMEASMLDADGYIIDRSPSNQMIVDDMDVDISSLYKEPPTWDQIASVIGAIIAGDQLQGSCTTGEPPSYDVDDVSFNPTLFSMRIIETAEQSVASGAIGACTVNQGACDIFEERSFLDGDPHVMVGAATASKSQGVTPKHLSKVWRISHEDAARTIEATTQLIHRDPGTILSPFSKLWNG